MTMAESTVQVNQFESHQHDQPIPSEEVIRVNLWCVPRAASTAFLKCMTYVPDSQVWLEPYHSANIFSKQGRHREEALSFLKGSWECDSNSETEGDFSSNIKEGYLAGDISRSWIKEQLEAIPSNKKFIFNKDMSDGLDGVYEDLPEGFRHTFLIRHPYKVFSSGVRTLNRGIPDHSKKIKLTGDLPEFLMPKGYYFKEQYDLYVHVKKNIEANPVIIDTDDLLENPGRVLKAYCKAIGITYSDELLAWKPGRECMDELWMVAKEVILAQNTGNPHKETFASTGFGKPAKCPDREELPEDVLFCADRCMGYYEEMYQHRLN